MIDAKELKNGFRIGEWRVQPRLGTMSRQGRIEYPSRNALRVLLILAAREGHIVSRSELVEAIWDNPAVGNAPLNRCLHELGSAFGDPSYLRSVPGRGFRIGQAVILEPQEAIAADQSWPFAALAGALLVLLVASAWFLSS